MKKMDGKSLQPKIILREKSHASISDFSKELSCLVCQEILWGHIQRNWVNMSEKFAWFPPLK